MVKLAHIVNPVKVGESSDLFFAQPITFKTMQVARELAQSFGIEVDLFSAQYAEDSLIVPSYFYKTPDLERSVLDLGNFTKPRKLPILKDILNRLYEATDAEYLIYTNVNIALQPYFYITVNKIIEQGYDSFSINRRIIPKELKNIHDLPLMYSNLGKSHPGHDCFIFPRFNYSKYNLGTICIGSDGIGKAMLANMFYHAEKFKVFKDLYLTFHIGDDKSWQNPILNDYGLHNRSQLIKIIKNLGPERLLERASLQYYIVENAFEFDSASIQHSALSRVMDWRKRSKKIYKVVELARKIVNTFISASRSK